MLLVEPLGGGECAPGREPEPAVGIALQRGEVVEQRRALLALGLLELGDLAGLALAGLDDLCGRLGARTRGFAPAW